MADLKDFAEQLVNLTVKEVNELAGILKDEYGITVKDVIHKEGKPFSKIYKVKDKELLLSEYL